MISLVKPFKRYLGKDAVYNFLNMTEESKYCSEVMKEPFNNKLVMTKEDHENFKNSTKCWSCDNDYINNDVKVRDHCFITGKYRGSAHEDCNIFVRLSHKIPTVFYNLKNYDSHLVMQELDKFNLKMNVILNGLEKCTSFSINLKCTSKPSFMSHIIVGNNFVAIRKGKIALKLYKPAYIGMHILDLSKISMFEFHYHYIES